MTISFNGGVDPEEIKFNDQDMEAVVLYNDQFPNGVTVWEKVVGVVHTITSGAAGPFRGVDGIAGIGSISPSTAGPLVFFIAQTNDVTINIEYLAYTNLPAALKFNGGIINLTFSGSYPFIAINRNANTTTQDLYDSLAIVGNNTTFELIYP